MDTLLKWAPAGLAFLIQFAVLVATVSYWVGGLELMVHERTKDRYRASKAASDFQLRDQRLAYLERELDRLESEVEDRPPQWLIQRLEEIERQLRLRKLSPSNMADYE